MSVRFTQSCPTCGRRVQIRASLIGYSVVCQHCSAEFIAESNGDASHFKMEEAVAKANDPLMIRVEEALKRAANQSAVF